MHQGVQAFEVEFIQKPPVYSDMKVLYMLGCKDDTVLQHGVVNSEVAFIHKPFQPDDLLVKVRALLDE